MRIVVARAAAAYGLAGEAAALLREQRLGLEGNTQHLLLLNTVAACNYLKLLLLGLRPDLRGPGEITALADLAAKHRPRLLPRQKAAYITDLLEAAERECAKVGRSPAAKRRHGIAQALHEITNHLTETRDILASASSGV